jgi:predicted CXXCH cytochrome family protein
MMALLLLVTAVAWAQVPEDDVLSGEQCKMCHAEQHEEWMGTLHSSALEGLKTSDHAGDSCLECHSTDYIYDNTLTLETAQYGITCAACHTPHDTPGDDKPAIADVGELCKGCHNADLAAGEMPEPGATLHHPTSSMMAGSGAIGVESVPSAHDVDCITCHLEGHQFAPAQSACDGCHGGAATIEDATAAVSAKLEEYGAVEGFAESWPAEYTNYTLVMNDGSNGIHNPGYAAAIVAAIDAALAEPAAEEAAPEEAAPEEAAPEEAAPEEPVELPTAGGVPLVGGPALLLLSGSIALAGGLGAYAWNRRR